MLCDLDFIGFYGTFKFVYILYIKYKICYVFFLNKILSKYKYLLKFFFKKNAVLR